MWTKVLGTYATSPPLPLQELFVHCFYADINARGGLEVWSSAVIESEEHWQLLLSMCLSTITAPCLNSVSSLQRSKCLYRQIGWLRA